MPPLGRILQMGDAMARDSRPAGPLSWNQFQNAHDRALRRCGDHPRSVAGEISAILAEIAGAVAFVSEDEVHGAERTLSAGFHGHVRKPIDPWELARLVAALTRGRP